MYTVRSLSGCRHLTYPPLGLSSFANRTFRALPPSHPLHSYDGGLTDTSRWSSPLPPLHQSIRNTHTRKAARPKRPNPVSSPFVIKSSCQVLINRFPGRESSVSHWYIYPHPHLICPFYSFRRFPSRISSPFFSGSALTITSRPRTKARIESAVFLFEGEKPKAEAEQISFGGIAPASRHYVHLWNGNVLRVRSSLASIGSHWCSRQWSICSHDSPLHPVPYCPFTQCR